MSELRYPRIVMPWLVMVLALMTSGAAVSATDFEPHSAHYDVKIKVFRGSMETQLLSDENGFTGTSQISPRGFARLASNGTIENRSLFRLNDGGVQPLVFEGNDSVSKRKKQASLNFDWDALRVTGKASQKKDGKRIETEVDAPIEAGIHDAISLQYALMHDLQNGALKTRYLLADADEQKLINITQLNATTLRVPYGEFEVVPVQHQVESSSRVTTFWFAKELDYLPVKIEQRRKGKRLMMAVLSDYQVLHDE